jgi:23S rRNA G2445 N2-methylase RlmL
MINDGRAPHWEVRVLGRDAVLVPVGWKDHRFSWRDTAVEGASDPTIATALVEVADIKSNDSIWDPFCGGGTELIIAKKRFPSLVTLGTDINPSAVLAAQAAADRCQVSAKFLSKNCFDVQGQKFDVILTNPPFGMRTVRGGARPLLEDFFVQASRSLKAGGRFVIMSHAPSTSLRWAGASGLACQRQIPVKLGGMDCQIQVFVPRN